MSNTLAPTSATDVATSTGTAAAADTPTRRVSSSAALMALVTAHGIPVTDPDRLRDLARVEEILGLHVACTNGATNLDATTNLNSTCTAERHTAVENCATSDAVFISIKTTGLDPVAATVTAIGVTSVRFRATLLYTAPAPAVPDTAAARNSSAEADAATAAASESACDSEQREAALHAIALLLTGATHAIVFNAPFVLPMLCKGLSAVRGDDGPASRCFESAFSFRMLDMHAWIRKHNGAFVSMHALAAGARLPEAMLAEHVGEETIQLWLDGRIEALRRCCLADVHTLLALFARDQLHFCLPHPFAPSQHGGVGVLDVRAATLTEERYSATRFPPGLDAVTCPCAKRRRR